MKDAILRKARESADLKLRFCEENAAELEACARSLAGRLAAGGRLFCMGNGGSACDAQHVAVEFLHPIIEKRRALPALALSADTAALTAIANDSDFARVFAEQIELLCRPGDVALGISTSGASANVNRGLRRARELGLLTIGFAGRDGGQMAEACDHCFTVRSWSIHRIQETHTLLLHLLWDQVHVALGADDVL
ncbi:MAG TPA: SIS domain-containing protein [Kofleriaceae bacterium]|nr:SIS domain-containing protein [Kofleriaceae bacterium]